LTEIYFLLHPTLSHTLTVEGGNVVRKYNETATPLLCSITTGWKLGTWRATDSIEIQKPTQTFGVQKFPVPNVKSKSEIRENSSANR
jgi:hypothetical protein